MDNLDELLGFLKSEKSEGRHVFSLASDDDFGFGVLTMEGYGTRQIFSEDHSFVENFLKSTGREFSISVVESWGSDFCFVLTEGVQMFAERRQVFTIENRWRGIEGAIEKGWKDGLVITGLCCSKKTGEYLLVMTESTEHQWYQWDLNYSDNIDESYHPTVVLDDPKCHRGVLTVMTTNDNRSSFTRRVRHPIEFP